ncbi:MAG: AAA family ATPase [Candidatus Nitrosopelagicus sp.]|nr:AAA family ATPase [Candidatus Nitrosopelagicus sp.]
MSDNIRLISVEIENYRQYYGNHKINFVTREEGFTVIMGKNGEGKSNLLNAINWCLYEEEPHGIGDDLSEHESENKSLSIINNRYIKETNPDTRADLKVDIWIEKGDTIYSITRTIGILKHNLETKTLTSGKEEILLKNDPMGFRIPKGCERLESPFSNFVVTKKGPHDTDFTDTIRFATPENMVKEILPASLSKYFLLDGEFLEAFWRKSKNIKEGIEQISQLHLITGALKNIQSHMMIPSKGFSKDTDEMTTKIREYDRHEKSRDKDGNESWTDDPRYKSDPALEDTYYHSTGQPRIDDLDEDIEKMNDDLIKISEEIKSSGWAEQDSLKERYGKLESELDDLGKEVDATGEKFLYNLIKKGPQIMLKNAIQSSIEIIDKEISIGGLPVKYKRLFADSLLERRRCVCREPLEPGHERTQHVMNFKEDLVGKEQNDDVALLGDDYKRFFLNAYDTFCKTNFEDPRTNHANLKNDFETLDEEFTDVKEKLKKVGGADGEKLIDRQRYIQEQIIQKNELKTATVFALKESNKNRGEQKVKLTEALRKNAKAAKVAYQLKKWDEIAIKLEKTYDELKDEIREGVRDTTWKNYKSLLANSSEFESFDIEPDYTVHLLDKAGFNKARNLSAGQSLLLTLSFVAAIREPTGYKFPLIVDSPAGKVDGPNTHNIGKCLPDFLPDAQLALLATNKEYTDFISPDPDYPDMPNTPVCKLFEEKINVQHFKIQKEKDSKNNNVGNSTILPAKLQFQDGKEETKGWMLVADE